MGTCLPYWKEVLIGIEALMGSANVTKFFCVTWKICKYAYFVSNLLQ